MMHSAAAIRAWAVLRLLGAVAVVAAVIGQLQRTVGNALESTTAYGSDVPTVVTNFLSFFTIQSNIFAAVVLVIGAILAWGRADATEPRWFAVLLVCATTYMIITGVVYNTLLRGIALPQGQTVPWSNEILHVVVPALLLLDLLFAPRRRALAWRTVWVVIVYPIVWVVYTMIRGPLVTAPGDGAPHWYPYPFLNPYTIQSPFPGYAGVAFWIVLIAAAIVATAFGVIAIGRVRARRAAAASGV